MEVKEANEINHDDEEKREEKKWVNDVINIEYLSR